MQSSMHMNREKGMVRDPAIEAALEDAEELRDQLQRGQEKFFSFWTLLHDLFRRSRKD